MDRTADLQGGRSGEFQSLRQRLSLGGDWKSLSD
jgi:hypothetical protein